MNRTFAILAAFVMVVEDGVANIFLSVIEIEINVLECQDHACIEISSGIHFSLVACIEVLVMTVVGRVL